MSAHRARFTAVAVVAVACLVSGEAAAFNTLSFDGRNTVRWRDSAMPIHYEIQADFPATSGTTDEQAIHASFSTWENAACADVDFTFDGATAGNGMAARDGRNRVVFTTSGFSNTTSGAVGVTYTEFSGDSRGWYISGGDIAINSYVDWSTNPGVRDMDLQSVVVHEAGHLIGLQHTPILAATMYFATAPGDTSQRDLHDDDRRGACFLYPAGTFSCTANVECPTMESNDTDQFGNPLVWGRATCQADGTCAISGAPPGDPIGSVCAGEADCASGLCVPSATDENNICSQACQLDVEGSCPSGFICLDYGEEFGSVCGPVGEGGLNDPCESPLDCASTVCVGLSDTEAICSEECNLSAVDSCPEGSICLESETPGEGLCIPGGDTPFGNSCESGLDCEGSVCLVFEDNADTGICSSDCSQNSPQPCPEGGACWPGAVDGEFFCVPGGDSPVGTPCESSLGCQGAMCVPFDEAFTDYRCGQPCEFRAGVNPCSDGFVCFPLDAGGVCLPSGTVPLGGACDSIFDCQSLLCLADDDVCTELCTSTCPLGFECVPLTNGLGGCVSDGTTTGDSAGGDTPGFDTGVPDAGDVGEERPTFEPDQGVSPDTGRPPTETPIDGGGGGDEGCGGGCAVAAAPAARVDLVAILGALVLGTRRRRRA